MEEDIEVRKPVDSSGIEQPPQSTVSVSESAKSKSISLYKHQAPMKVLSVILIVLAMGCCFFCSIWCGLLSLVGSICAAVGTFTKPPRLGALIWFFALSIIEVILLFILLFLLLAFVLVHEAGESSASASSSNSSMNAELADLEDSLTTFIYYGFVIYFPQYGIYECVYCLFLLIIQFASTIKVGQFIKEVIQMTGNHYVEQSA